MISSSHWQWEKLRPEKKNVLADLDVEVSDTEREGLLCDDRLILGHDYV